VTERRRIEEALDRQIEALEQAERFKEESLEALRESERLLSEAQRIAHIGSWEWDIETDRMKCTDEEYRLFGLVPQSFDATVATGHFLYHPDDLALRAETIVNALQDHRPFAYDHRTIRPDGTIRILRCLGKVVLDPAGTPISIIGTSQDVTEIRQAERLVLIDDLLDYARMQAGKFSVSPSPTDFPSLVEEIVASFQPDALSKQIQIDSSVEVTVPVCLDRRRILQVIANLLSNAIKFTPNGGKVQLSACVKDDQLVTEVSDSGFGIAAEDLPKLFAPFKQLDTGLTRRVGGVGLGLSISKAIVNAHGGTIEAQSGPGKGSAFTFRIPIA
jgi:signal transduction histidine kinase